MSVTVSKADGVTVLTLTSDPQSPWPPLCQILKNLCYSPACCSVSQHLRSLNSTSQTVLGTLQIFIGLLNIRLGAIFLNAYSPNWMLMYYTGFPFWLGTLMLLRSMSVTMVVVSALELCVVISSVVLGIRALRSKEKEQNKSTDDPELYRPLLEEVPAQPVA